MCRTQQGLLQKKFVLRLHPAGVACPELVEGLSTNGNGEESTNSVHPERSEAKSKGLKVSFQQVVRSSQNYESVLRQSNTLGSPRSPLSVAPHGRSPRRAALDTNMTQERPDLHQSQFVERLLAWRRRLNGLPHSSGLLPDTSHRVHTKR